MQIIKIECPSCGATPEVDKNMEFGFCSYCGTKIYIPNAIQSGFLLAAAKVRSFFETR